MRTFFVLVAIFASFATARQVAADQAADEAAIRKAVEQVNALHNQHDVKALVALFDETVEDWGGTVKGREAMEKNVSELFAREKDRLQKELAEIGIVFVTPNVAIYKSRRVTTGTVDANGKPQPPRKVMFARIFVKRDGKWYLAAWFGSPLPEE